MNGGFPLLPFPDECVTALIPLPLTGQGGREACSTPRFRKASTQATRHPTRFLVYLMKAAREKINIRAPSIFRATPFGS
jgi:hypothetical protein